MPPGSRFCPACGASLFRACHACGAEQPSSAAFCSECGVALQPGARRGGATIDHEERRVVTILFADLAGSTALGERIDPEDLRALQGELYTFMDDEVVRFGGTTEKFAGDAILAVFGVPQAHEDDPERAVRAALAIRARFGAFAGRVATAHGGTVGIRLGVETGEVVAGRDAVSRGELMVTGDVVNVAARLQQPRRRARSSWASARVPRPSGRSATAGAACSTRRGSPSRCLPGTRRSRARSAAARPGGRSSAGATSSRSSGSPRAVSSASAARSS